jgi:uncharacterized RDD family membrane protein YckC
VAGAIDYGLILLMWIPILIFLELRPARWVLPSHWEWLVGGVVSLTSLLPLTAYQFLVSTWKQSIGRNLMQLHVVNRFGLTPTTRVVALRSLLRMLPLWLLALLPTIGQLGLASFYVGVVLFFFAVAWLLLDLVWMLVARNGSSLHDRIAGTRVVWKPH